MTSTKAAAPATIQDVTVFDVDPHTGFMPPQVPLSRLPSQWEVWEATLDAAIAAHLQLGDKPGLTEKEMAESEMWRARVRQLPVVSTSELESSKIHLRRAHLVLSYMMHFYIQSLPPDAPIVVPRSLSLPLLRISARLEIPPLLTFSDTVLYNWVQRTPSDANAPTIDNLKTHTMFSGLIDEEEFYLGSARIELRGVEALELMRVTMDEIFTGDQAAIRRISGYLHKMASVIDELKVLLLSIRQRCRPDQYYNEVRPWLRGEDSDVNKRKWVFEGLEEDPSLKTPTELSGPSAGQSSMVHVLDVFLGVDHQSSPQDKPSFMSRMQTYMPKNHRLFLDHLASNPRPLRAFVMASKDAELHEAYNRAVLSLKEFRDAHMIIVTLYILGPARRAAKAAEAREMREPVEAADRKPLKGTGDANRFRFNSCPLFTSWLVSRSGDPTFMASKHEKLAVIFGGKGVFRMFRFQKNQSKEARFLGVRNGQVWVSYGPKTAVGFLLIPCTLAAPNPNIGTVINLRIEGGHKTIFEGPVFTRGHDIETAQGGKHPCDGTNLGANPSPGPTCTSALDDASKLKGFEYDGEFFPQFDDFNIQTIAGESQQPTQNQFWGLFLNYKAPKVGGCQQQVKFLDNVLFAWDIYHKDHALKLSGSQLAHVNQPVTLTVEDGDTGVPIAGAEVGGRTSDAEGHVSVKFDSVGVKTVKAERADSIRSNGLIIVVVP
ncbi:Indoleamine 2,3-dioxygenase 1 [Hypsizygus marmoreus]|uniref:Indoleamine 2,3-dioxygenase 1 n=1 Tax=Hypsizygus marmoreus TaxID=39966 RepID=A0A369K3K5_HYPMA|nr:Indoleamine 2,3-dioxygenase 1 [Hypsizygus marmoreus]